MRYNICLIKPDQYIHSLAFIELAELLLYSLQELGFEVQIQFNELDNNACNILIGCHLLDTALIKSVPKSSIIINTEQIYADFTNWNLPIMEWVKHFETWDYSERNIIKFHELGLQRIKHLKIGFQKELARIPQSSVQDIDVLFYGTMNERRSTVVNLLKAAGLKVHTAFGIYGPERDQLISRSKIVLNNHFYHSHIFEIIRVFYLMTNSVAVVGEVNPSTSIDPIYLNGIYGVPYLDLHKACLELLEDSARRTKLRQKALETIQQFPQKKFTAELLD